MTYSDERFADEDSLWTRVVTREYAEKQQLPIDPSFKVVYTGSADMADDSWVVVNVPLGWTDGSYEGLI